MNSHTSKINDAMLDLTFTIPDHAKDEKDLLCRDPHDIFRKGKALHPFMCDSCSGGDLGFGA